MLDADTPANLVEAIEPGSTSARLCPRDKRSPEPARVGPRPEADSPTIHRMP